MSRKGSRKKVKVQEFVLIWNVENTIIPEVIGATGIATNGLKKSLEVIPSKYLIDY